MFLAVAAFVVLAWSPAVWACPGCKEAVAGDGEEGGVSRAGIAFSISVLFMLSMPFLLVAGFGAAFYRLYRKQQRLRATPAPEQQNTHADEPVPV